MKVQVLADAYTDGLVVVGMMQDVARMQKSQGGGLVSILELSHGTPGQSRQSSVSLGAFSTVDGHWSQHTIHKAISSHDVNRTPLLAHIAHSTHLTTHHRARDRADPISALCLPECPGRNDPFAPSTCRCLFQQLPGRDSESGPGQQSRCCGCGGYLVQHWERV